MSKERIIYRFRYEDPYRLRQKVPFLNRYVQLIREIRYGNGLKSYQTMGRFSKEEQLKLEEVMGRFPQRIRGNQPDFIGITIANLILQLRGIE